MPRWIKHDFVELIRLKCIQFRLCYIIKYVESRLLTIVTNSGPTIAKKKHFVQSKVGHGSGL